MTLVAHHIGSEELSATITNFGASLMDLRLAGVDHGLVLGFDDPLDQADDKQFMGAVIGRYANRIAGGRALIGDQTLALEKNENGTTHLHGGADGFSSQLWAVDVVTPQSVKLTYQSSDGQAGFPGQLLATAHYEISGPILRLTLSALSDQDTIVNLCHHPYFNLDGLSDVAQHSVHIPATHYLPVDAALVPTGVIAPVDGTDFDFTDAAKLRSVNYNNTYCLHRQQRGALAHAATLQAGRVTMALHTTQPGLHLYNGYKIKPGAAGHGGKCYAAHSGLCLEAQAWPDSPNHPAFPSVVLNGGLKLEQVTEYRFSSTPV